MSTPQQGHLQTETPVTNNAEQLITQAEALLDKADAILNHKQPDAATDIVVVLDRSGSMESMRNDMEGGFNEFIREQKKVRGEAFVTLSQFDYEYETVYSRRPLAKVPHLSLVPRGSTSLIDAMGRSICHALDVIPEGHLCIFVVITDGGENSSKEFTSAQVKGLTEKCQKQRDWQFIYLGANQDAFNESGRLGVDMSFASNYRPKNARAAMHAMCRNVGTYRGTQRTQDLQWSAEQREALEK